MGKRVLLLTSLPRMQQLAKKSPSKQEKRPDSYQRISGLLLKLAVALSLPNSEHFSSTCGAHTLSCRPTILHGYSLGIFHFSLGTALHAVCLHLFTSTFGFTMNDRAFVAQMSIASGNLTF